ncbi:CATRA conflict system CASPASE/TPR repeat-associated protein [Actinacidiphila glaucinigra]|uniref:CATRA conflict system CASPASE/TPR repeat-associated protein n=1 Tax=Actinacidiphila glaucinigra TaxID=235986 RepID=UPI002E31FB57|nr:CATRA conflict system CASPASE/TPR repeat-associated protein [Actinacidiphila glaucinigra]
MSSEPRLAREALHLHYLFASQRFGDPGGHLLDLLWETCARAGMDTALQADGELSLPTDLTDGVGFHSLRQRTDATGTRQAVLYRLHDVVGLTVMLAADDGPGRTAEESSQVLRALERTWEEARAQAAAVRSEADNDTSLLGTAHIYRSLSVPDGTSPPDSAFVGEKLCRELSPHSLLSRPVKTDTGLTLWEITRSGELLSSRRDLLLTTEANDQQEGLLDDWSWYAEHGGLVPLTRYLIGAAQMRENYRVRLDSAAALSERLDRLRRTGEELTRQCRELTASSATRRGTGRRALARWERIAEQAQQALAEERLASATHHDLRTMTRSLEIASAGLRALGAHADGRPRVLDDDEELRLQLAAVLDDDVTYLGIAREQVAEAARVATESAVQRLQSHQQYLSLIQTTVIGSVLLALTAIQALAYKLPVPARLHAPLIALLGTSGLVLPLLVVRRWRGGTGGRIGGVLETGSLAVTGAAAGWLLGRSFGHTTPSVLAGAVVLAVLGSWLTRKSLP